MKTSPTFWLTVLGSVQDVVIVTAWILFMIIPKQGRREYFYLGAYLTVIFVNDTLGTIGFHVFNLNMNPVTNIAELFFFTFLILIYKKHIQLRNFTALANVMIALFLMFALTNLIFFQGFIAFNSNTWATASASIVAITLYYFYLLIKKLPLDRNTTTLPMFWINMAIFIHYLETFLVFSFLDYLTTVLHDDVIIPYYFHFSVGLICYGILVYALLMIRNEYKKGVITPNVFPL